MSNIKTLDSLSSTKPLSNLTSFYKESSNSFRNSSLLNKSIKSPISSDNKVRNHLINLNKTLKTENYSENGYINRPTITFRPEMPLHNLEKKELINPSKLNYVVSINPPPCHKIQKGFRSVSNRNNKNNLSFSFLRPYLQNEVDEFEKGLLTSLRKERFSKNNNLF